MLSRVANSIYWMSRYIERAENVARFVDVNLHLMLDLPVELQEQWRPLTQVTGDYAYFAEEYEDPTEENVIRFLTFDADYLNSIVSCVAAAQEDGLPPPRSTGRAGLPRGDPEVQMAQKRRFSVFFH